MLGANADSKEGNMRMRWGVANAVQGRENVTFRDRAATPLLVTGTEYCRKVSKGTREIVCHL